MPKQQGSLLIELSLVLAVLLVLGTGLSTWLKHTAEQQKAENLAYLMLTVQQGVQRYIDTYATQLLHASSSETQLPGGQAWRPTIADLIQAQFLAPEVQGGDHITIYIEPAGCGPDTCHIEALIVYDAPLLLDKGGVDLAATAQWLTKTQGKGYVVYEHSPQWLTGAARRLANPSFHMTHALAVGSVALIATTDNAESAYLRLKERRNPDFQADVDIAGALRVEQDIHTQGLLFLAPLAQPQAPCTEEGALSREQSRLFICEAGQWVQVAKNVLTDPLTIKAFFEVVLEMTHPPLPLYQGGYYGLSVGARRAPVCWLANPLVGTCACPPTSTGAMLIGTKPLPSYHSTSFLAEARTISIYGCAKS